MEQIQNRFELPVQSGELICIKDGVERKADEEHYHDDCVDVRTISEFCLTVFTNSDGKTVVVNFDDNLFSPSDLVAAYGKSLEGLGLESEERENYISKYRSYLIACGCEKEELENE